MGEDTNATRAVVHERHRAPGRGRFEVIFQVAANALGQAQTSTVGRVGSERPVLTTGWIHREELFTQLDVLREATRGEHDAATGPNGVDARGRLRDDASDATLSIRDQFGGGRVDPVFHAQVVTRLHQTSGERRSVNELGAVLEEHEVNHVATESLDRVDQSRDGALRGVQELGEVRASHDSHAEKGRFVELRTHNFAYFRAYLERAVGFGANRPMPRSRLGLVAVDVANLGAGNPLQAGLRLEEVNHFGGRSQKGIDALSVVVLSDDRLQVRAELLGSFVHTVFLGELCAGGPGPTARPRGCSTAVFFAFEHEHAQALVGGGHRSRQTAGTRTNDNDVVLIRKSRFRLGDGLGGRFCSGHS